MASICEKATEVARSRPKPMLRSRNLFWIVSSNMSILTTKYLMTSGYNYPLHLLVAHLIAIIAIEAACIVISAFLPEQTTLPRKTRPSSDSTSPFHATVSFILYSTTTAVATMLGYQALQHFGTFPVVVTTLLCVTIPWEIYRGGLAKGTRAWGYLLVFSCCFLLVYLTDAKLDFKGVGSVALATGFATLANAQDQWLPSKWKLNALGSNAVQRHVWALLAHTIALTVTIVSLWKWETPIYSPLAGYRVRWVLALNIASSALAFKLAWSPFWTLRTARDTRADEDTTIDSSFPILSPWVALITTSIACMLFDAVYPMNRVQFAACFVMMELLAALHANQRSQDSTSHDSDGDGSLRVSLLSPQEPSQEAGCPLLVSDVESNPGSKELALESSTSLVDYIKNERRRILLRGLIVLMLWLSLTYSGMKSSFLELSNLRTQGEENLRTMDLVVSQYDETESQLSWQLQQLMKVPAINSRKTRIIIYDKGNASDHIDLRHDIERHTGLLPEIVIRPNVGKEAETYLHHIVSRWDSLATHTFFMQARMHNFRTSQQRINDYFVPETGFLPLSPFEVCQSYQGCTDHSTWSEEGAILGEMYGRGNGKKPFGGLLLIYRGQFVVSSSRIRSLGKEHFVELLSELRDSQSYTHSDLYADRPWMPGKQDSMMAPLFGYTVERMWPTILQCSELRIARNCPSLTSGFLRALMPGNAIRIEDCQCVDSQQTREIL